MSKRARRGKTRPRTADGRKSCGRGHSRCGIGGTVCYRARRAFKRCESPPHVRPCFRHRFQLELPAPVPAPTPASAPAPQVEIKKAADAPGKLVRQVVDYVSHGAPSTVVIDTGNTFLYLVLNGGQAMRYGIGVGREGFTWSGEQAVARKAEWPDWRPPVDMLSRQPYLPRFMAGGPGCTSARRSGDVSGVRPNIEFTARISPRRLEAGFVGLYPADQRGCR